MLNEAVAKMASDVPVKVESDGIQELYAEPETPEETEEEIVPEEFQGMLGMETEEPEESEDALDGMLTGQMKIEEILREWEEKQRENARKIEEEKMKAAAEAASRAKQVAAEEVPEPLSNAEEAEPEDSESEEAALEDEYEEVEDDYEELEDDYEELEEPLEDDEDYDDIDEQMEEEYEELEEELENDYDDSDDFIEDDQDDFFDGEEIEEPEEPVKPVKPAKAKVQKKKPEIEIDDREIDDPEDMRPGKYDTGFVVQGRYDLSVTSEIGLKAGLTEEQKELFSYFVPVRGMSEQLVEILENDKNCKTRYGTSRTGNLLIVGQKGAGKTVLAVDIVKAIQKQRNLKQGKVAIVTGEALNKKDLKSIVKKLQGGAIIIEKAGKLSPKKIKELNHLMEDQTGELLFVLEEQRKPLERILTANPSFKKKFTSRLEIPKFISHDLVTFGQTYANENGYRIDEDGILALYARIDLLQREDHSVTVAEVKDIIDEAIEHSQKANVKHLMKRVFGKNKDDSDRIILKEQDF